MKTSTIETLIKLRLDNAMTQKDFGLECGLSKSVISQYEQGTRNPSKKALYAICNRFEVSPSVFNLPTDSPYTKTKSIERRSDVDKIMNNLVDYNEVLKKENETLKVYKDRRQLQDMVNSSIGLDTWILQSKVIWKGLSVEISIADWGNTYECITKTLGYNKSFAHDIMREPTLQNV